MQALFVYPGKERQLTIVHPPLGQAEVTFEIDWPEAWRDLQTRFVCEFGGVEQPNPDGGKWYQNNRYRNVTFGDGKPVELGWRKEKYGQSLPASQTWTLPIGEYEWLDVTLWGQGAGEHRKIAKYVSSADFRPRNDQTKFEIKLGQLNQFNVPLTSEMIQRLDKKKRVIKK